MNKYEDKYDDMETGEYWLQLLEEEDDGRRWKRDERNISQHQYCDCHKHSICFCFWDKQDRIRHKLKRIFRRHLEQMNKKE